VVLGGIVAVGNGHRRMIRQLPITEAAAVLELELSQRESSIGGDGEIWNTQNVALAADMDQQLIAVALELQIVMNDARTEAHRVAFARPGAVLNGVIAIGQVGAGQGVVAFGAGDIEAALHQLAVSQRAAVAEIKRVYRMRSQYILR